MPTGGVSDGVYETDRLHSPDDSYGFRVIAKDIHEFLCLVSVQHWTSGAGRPATHLLLTSRPIRYCAVESRQRLAEMLAP
jgi:hypothetical protein